MIKVGFTGTQRGMTVDQLQSVIDLLLKCGGEGDEFHHGGCVGADTEAAKCAAMFKYRTIRHPGDNPAKQDHRFRDYDYRVVLPNLQRNHVIVDEVNMMIAAPGEPNEVLRSGTWATIRYARKRGRLIHVVLPDGTVT